MTVEELAKFISFTTLDCFHNDGAFYNRCCTELVRKWGWIIITKREAAIVSAYTGYLLGKFTDLQEYIEEILKRPVFTHELANKETIKLIKEKSKDDFMSIKIN